MTVRALAAADLWFNWRNSLLASDRFRRLASGFLPTRWIARRRAGALFDLVAGFVYSQVLLACVRLKLFDILSEGPQSLEKLAHRTSLQTEAIERLLSAAVSLRLVERRSGRRYGLGDVGAAMVGNAAVAAMIDHHAALYADLADPVALLRKRGGKQLAAYWPYAESSDMAALDRVAPYTALMAASQPLVADEVLDAYPLGRHRCLLDVGGGDGTFIRRAAQRAPHLKLMLFDLPAVAEQAKQHFQQGELRHRAIAVGGSFLTDDLPAGADVATVIRVVHDHDDAAALQLLRAIYKALTPGGALVLAEPMARTRGAQAMGDAYFGFYLLAMGSGKPRSRDELQVLLQAAGFESVRKLTTRMPLQTSIMVALKPAKKSANN